MKNEILVEVPADWPITELTIRNNNESNERDLLLKFEAADNPTLLIKGIETVENVLELLELQIDNIRVVSALSDQRENYPIKLLIDTDRGLFEIWAKQCVAN